MRRLPDALRNPFAGVKLLETECAELEHKAHPALHKLTMRVRCTLVDTMLLAQSIALLLPLLCAPAIMHQEAFTKAKVTLEQGQAFIGYPSCKQDGHQAMSCLKTAWIMSMPTAAQR